MKKKEFLKELEEYLIGIQKSDREEIMQDYEEHFKVGKKKKRSDADIIKALGEPKKIARDVRTELSSSKRIELMSEAVEFWIEAKKFSRYLFNEVMRGIETIIYSEKKRKGKEKISKLIIVISLIIVALLVFSHPFFVVIVLGIIGYLYYRHIRKVPENESREHRIKHSKIISAKSAKNEGNSTAKVILSMVFNLLFFIWFWISMLSAVIVLLVSSVASIIFGLFIIVFTAFSLISYNTILIKGILLSGLFSGLGIMILGGLLLWLSQWIATYFFLLTKKYIKLNMRFIKR